MRGQLRWSGAVYVGLVVSSLTVCCAAQSTRPSTSPVKASVPQITERDFAALQDQLLKLVRVSPTLAEVVARDPSLLSNAEYVTRSNPELARFLEEHPEIAQNPDFYLFNNLHASNEPPSNTLERKLWPQLSDSRSSPIEMEVVTSGIPFLVFVCILGALLWLTHVFLENRRWGRIFKLQTDVHSKLIERFGTSEEVLTYMGTEAGKRFLEATPIAVGFERKHERMTFRDCAWEAEITQALSAGHWPDASGPELRAHVETCPRCSDLVLVTETIQRARTASVLAEHPISPSLLWWRAQLRRRNYTAEQMSQPISFAHTFAWLVSGLLAVVFVVSQYRYGLRWGHWWSQINAAHVLSLWSLAAGHLQWKLFLVIPAVGVFLLSGIVLYLARE